MKETPHSTLSDQELLQRFNRDKNNDWLGILLERYTLLLYGVCMKYLKDEEKARDAVQQIFYKTLQELQKYPVVYFKSWLYMVAKNHCLMQLRESKTKIPVTFEEDQFELKEEEKNADDLEKNEKALDLLPDALEDLKPEQRECVTLFYLEKKSYQEISDKTGFNYMQVKSYIQNGKRNLKLFIEKKLSEKTDG